MRMIVMLILSNLFMTYAWYGQLKESSMPLWKAVLISWGIAFFEYCLMIPANRYGYQEGYSAFQLKIIQEILTLLIFTGFAVMYLKEPFETKYIYSFFCIVGAVYFAFMKK